MENVIREFLLRLLSFYSSDTIAAGLQMAYLPDKNLYYVAVHRFPTNVASRTVVAKATESTLAEAVAKCEQVWDNIITQIQMDRAGVN